MDDLEDKAKQEESKNQESEIKTKNPEELNSKDDSNKGVQHHNKYIEDDDESGYMLFMQQFLKTFILSWALREMIYTNSDGGARGNPGPGAIGVIVRREGEILRRYSGFIGESVTNNIAEYEGLIKALEIASEYTKDEVTCILDSELIVKQLLGEYRVKHPKLLELFLKVQRLQEGFNKIRYLHVSRWNKFQRIADELLNEELDNLGYKKYRYKK